MADAKKLKRAKAIYADLIKMLDKRDWKYDRKDDELTINSGIVTDDFNIEFVVYVDAERELVRYLSRIPVVFPEDKRIEGAIATCVANNGMVNGSFDYSVSTGELYFKLVASYMSGSELSADLLENIILVSSAMVDRYNDRFFGLAKGMMTLEQFINAEE